MVTAYQQLLYGIVSDTWLAISTASQKEGEHLLRCIQSFEELRSPAKPQNSQDLSLSKGRVSQRLQTPFKVSYLLIDALAVLPSSEEGKLQKQLQSIKGSHCTNTPHTTVLPENESHSTSSCHLAAPSVLKLCAEMVYVQSGVRKSCAQRKYWNCISFPGLPDGFSSTHQAISMARAGMVSIANRNSLSPTNDLWLAKNTVLHFTQCQSEVSRLYNVLRGLSTL